MNDANCWHNDSEQWQQMNSGKWLQGPKNDCIIIKEGLLWSEDDHTDGLRNFNKWWCCDWWSMWANWKFSHMLNTKRIRDNKICVTWEPYMGNQTLKLELTWKMELDTLDWRKVNLDRPIRWLLQELLEDLKSFLCFSDRSPTHIVGDQVVESKAS